MFRRTSILFILLLILLDIGYFFASVSLGWIILLLAVYLHLLVFGSIFIQWNFYLRSYNKGAAGKMIALTFDDGPGEETAAILDILKQQKVQAAFFSIGKNAAASPELVRRWHEEGHLVGNHSYHHGFNFDWQTAKKMGQEISRTNDVIAEITGHRPKLFRPPYGVTNPNLAKAVKQTGMYSIGWNIRSFDTKAKDPQQLLQKILGKLRGGDIILLHDSTTITREILTILITEARKKGFTFARVDKMLEIDAYE